MLQIRDVEVAFGLAKRPVAALSGVDLDAPDGRMTAILGPSGCGKTTLLRVLAGFLRPSAGEVRDGAQVLSGPHTWVRPERRGIGFVPQEGALFPHLTVAGNIGFGLTGGGRQTEIRGRRQRHNRVEEMLELVGLSGLGRRRPDELSGGQQQRVALARALALRPRAVLLDEPFSAVDASLRLELGRQITDLLRDLGTTAVLVTHDQAEALSLADHVAVMREGRVVQADRPDRLYARPTDRDTAGFVGEVVLLPGLVEPRRAVGCALGTLPLAEDAVASTVIGSACTVMLRPEQLRLSEHGVPAQVAARHFYGHDATVTLRLGPLGDGPEVLLRSEGSAAPQIGEQVAVTVAGQALMFL